MKKKIEPEKELILLRNKVKELQDEEFASILNNIEREKIKKLEKQNEKYYILLKKYNEIIKVIRRKKATLEKIRDKYYKMFPAKS